jgi:hypothetical protein
MSKNGKICKLVQLFVKLMYEMRVLRLEYQEKGVF